MAKKKITEVPEENKEIKENTEEAPAKPSATVIGDRKLNIRPDPSMDNPPIGTLLPGTEVELLEDLGEWCRIPDGYVMRQYLAF